MKKWSLGIAALLVCLFSSCVSWPNGLFEKSSSELEYSSSTEDSVSKEENSSNKEEEEKGEEETVDITPVTFDNIVEIKDVKTFISEVDKADGTHDNDAKTVGSIISPYFEMTINETDVECYAVRTSIGAHSFAMVDVDTAAFPLTVALSVDTAGKTVKVLPESYGVKTELTLQGATAQINEYGNYTFVVGGDKTKALTLFVREAEEYVAPSGYDVVRIPAGTHGEKIAFTKEKQVLYFEKGVHYLKYNVDFLSNTEVYLESGAYVYAIMPDKAKETPTLAPDWAGMTRWKALFEGNNVQNVKISGRGMIDLTKLDWHARSAIRFDLSKNVTVEGITLNNAPEWTVYFTQSQDINVEEVLLFGYRQNSDGICMVDSRNTLVKNCFARSGDDLFEVKSMYGDCNIPIENNRFEKCNAWPDKARGLGIIAESVRDMNGIYFSNCSVGFASAEWMDELASIIVYLAGKAKVDEVYFEDIELYNNAKYPVNVTIDKGASAVIENVYFKNIRIYGDEDVRIANNSTVGGQIKNVWFDSCTRNGNAINTYAALSLKLTNVARNSIYVNRRSGVAATVGCNAALNASTACTALGGIEMVRKKTK